MADPRIRTRLVFGDAGEALEDALAYWDGTGICGDVFTATIALAARALLQPVPNVPLRQLLALETDWRS